LEQRGGPQGKKLPKKKVLTGTKNTCPPQKGGNRYLAAKGENKKRKTRKLPRGKNQRTAEHGHHRPGTQEGEKSASPGPGGWGKKHGALTKTTGGDKRTRLEIKNRLKEIKRGGKKPSWFEKRKKKKKPFRGGGKGGRTRKVPISGERVELKGKRGGGEPNRKRVFIKGGRDGPKIFRTRNRKKEGRKKTLFVQEKGQSRPGGT